MRTSKLRVQHVAMVIAAAVAVVGCAPSIAPMPSSITPVAVEPPSSGSDRAESERERTKRPSSSSPSTSPSESGAESTEAASESGTEPTSESTSAGSSEPGSTPTDIPSGSSWDATIGAIDSVFKQPTFRTATWGALVLNQQGDTIYAYNAEKLMIPASNVKIVTAATALAQLGPEFRFRPTALALALRDTMPSDFGPTYDTTWLKTRTLGEVLPTMLKQSQNRLAEQIFKTVGVELTGSLLRDSAIAVTTRQLADWQIPNDGFIVYDGSGYDRANYLSAETIAHILLVMRNDSAFVKALPIAGVDGTLIRRMRATSAAGNAMAKTGSLFSIRSLSGYLTTASGEQLIFSLMCNAYTVPASAVTAAMDRVVARLADVAEGRR